MDSQPLRRLIDKEGVLEVRQEAAEWSDEVLHSTQFAHLLHRQRSPITHQLLAHTLRRKNIEAFTSRAIRAQFSRLFQILARGRDQSCQIGQPHRAVRATASHQLAAASPAG